MTRPWIRNPPPRPVLGAPPSAPSISPTQAALAVGATVGLAAAAVFGAPLWGAILLGSGAAVVANKAISAA